jgi:NTE family protein
VQILVLLEPEASYKHITLIKTGISLSGGGTRGIAHLGVLQALEERGIFPAMVAGTSSGALIGAMYCAGMKPAEIYEHLHKIKLLRLLRPNYRGRGLFTLTGIGRYLKRFLPEHFNDLRIPLVINTCNLHLHCEEFFNEGKLMPPLLASLAVPGFFAPVRLNGHFHADGGIIDNMPIKPLQQYCDFTIGSHSNPIGEKKKINSIKSVLERTFHIINMLNVNQNKPHFDLLIEPGEMTEFTVFNMSQLDEAYTTGYTFTKELLLKAENQQLLRKVLENDINF